MRPSLPAALVSRSFLAIALIASLAACDGSTENPSGEGGAGGSGATGGTGATGATGGSGASGGSGATGGGADFGACSLPGQCLLVEPGCCGGCGEISLPQVEPINAEHAQDYYDATCGEENPACPDCAGFRDPGMFAWCDAGHCAEADIDTHPLGQCSSASDCVLRAGVDCCETCGLVSIEQLVAINATAQPGLGELVCPADGGACPPCVPEYPANVVAHCDAGRCVVAELQPGG
jgi:hypothetical protein